jgi:hypothetical protein
MNTDFRPLDPSDWQPRETQSIERAHLQPTTFANLQHAAIRNSINPGTADILIIGDSIGEGWYGNSAQPDHGTYFGRARSAVSRALNANGTHGRWIPAGAGWFPSLDRFSAIDTSTNTPNGFSLRGRQMPAGAAPATNQTNPQVCDRIVVYYRARNLWATANIVIKLDGVTVLDTPTVDTTTPPYCTVAFGERVVAFDSGPLPLGPHYISVEQRTFGGFNGTISWDGAYFYRGDYTTGVRFWNGSAFGRNFTHYNSFNDPTLNHGHLSNVRQGLTNPSLLIWTLGVNSGVDPGLLESSILTAVADVREAQDVAGQLHCSQVLVVPFATGSKTEAQWTRMRDVYYRLGASLDCDVWDWGELTGSVAAGNDIYQMTDDNVHPYEDGHRMIGDWLGAKILASLSPTVAAETVASDGSLRAKRLFDESHFE